jgi:hypothetical protein
MADAELLDRCAKELGRIEEDALHSAKGHFAAADRWDAIHLWIGIPSAIAGAAAGVSALKACPVLAATLAMLAAVLAAMATFLNPNARSTSHLTAGNQYLGLRSSSRIVREIEMLASPETTAERVQQLATKRDELNAASPRISRWAYEQGKKGIASGEARHRVDGKR